MATANDNTLGAHDTTKPLRTAAMVVGAVFLLFGPLDSRWPRRRAALVPT